MGIDWIAATCPECGAKNTRLPPCSSCGTPDRNIADWKGPHPAPDRDAVICGSCPFEMSGQRLGDAFAYIFKLPKKEG